MLRIKKIIMESLYDDQENGIIEFEFGDLLPNQAQVAFASLKDSLMKIGIENCIQYPDVRKIAIITTQDLAQTARELAENSGFVWVNEIFDVKPEDPSNKSASDSMNARMGSGFDRRWGF